MAIRINNASVIHTYSDTIPHAADRIEDYLRAVADGIKELDAAVSLAMDTLATDGFRSSKTPCLAATPTARRQRHFRMAHFAEPSNSMLRVGWYMVGGEKRTALVGPNQSDFDAAWDTIQAIHIYAVMPAIQGIVDSRRGGASGGFMGI